MSKKPRPAFPGASAESSERKRLALLAARRRLWAPAAEERAPSPAAELQARSAGSTGALRARAGVSGEPHGEDGDGDGDARLDGSAKGRRRSGAGDVSPEAFSAPSVQSAREEGGQGREREKEKGDTPLFQCDRSFNSFSMKEMQKFRIHIKGKKESRKKTFSADMSNRPMLFLTSKL